MIGSKLTGVTVSTLLSSRFSNNFYPSTISCVWVAMCMCNELSMKAMKFFKQKFFFFFFFLTHLNKTKPKDRNLYKSTQNLNQTLSSMLKMILSNICLEWKESKIWICNMRNSSRKSKVRRRRRRTLIKLIVINFKFCHISARTKENKTKQENKHKV